MAFVLIQDDTLANDSHVPQMVDFASNRFKSKYHDRMYAADKKNLTQDLHARIKEEPLTIARMRDFVEGWLSLLDHIA